MFSKALVVTGTVLLSCVTLLKADPPTDQPTEEPTAHSYCDAVACEGIDYCCQVSDVNGVLVVSTPKSYLVYPDAFEMATIHIDYMSSRLDQVYLDGMAGHIVYVYHGDPYLTTGIIGGNVTIKLEQYDYLSDIYGFAVDTLDGRAFDYVYGYGGYNYTAFSSILDCNLLPSCADDIYWTESILHHEFGHTIRNIALFNGNRTVYDYFNVDAYNYYLNSIGPENAVSYYCAFNSDELFSCLTQVWFLGTAAYWNYENYQDAEIYMAFYLPEIYNALTSLYGPSVQATILSLTDVSTIPYYPDWLYYDALVGEYGNHPWLPWSPWLSVYNHWQSIKYIGCTECPDPTTTSTTTTQPPAP